ncbi:hypothetical protein QL919_13750 [Psychrobacter sp. APC 3426]|uniref:hypothetical protein n=1 Tax=Psychrobacter sp. APC 3426 TaxID=3035177 RepID=UPI0025B59C60|nr:hypothetical protein [Psychrobacter sp. APC 3426]MDN3399791.1 hypothetical protein [Psychrobacter sp. APC 3426]
MNLKNKQGNISKLFAVAFTVSLVSFLSSCYATSGLADIVYDNKNKIVEETKTVFNDEVIAIGKPNLTIAGHEHALALVGNKYSYLIEPSRDNSELFKDIFSQVDLRYLYLNPSKARYTIDTKAITKQLEVVIDKESNCQYDHGCADLSLHFKKPITASYSDAKEWSALENLGFGCTHQYELQKRYLVCNRDISVGFTVAQPITNVDSIPHQFKQPLQLTINQKFSKTSTGPNLLKALVVFAPITIAFDVITFPLQVVHLGNDMQKNWH